MSETAIRTQAALELSAEALEQAELEFRKLGCNALAALMCGRARTARAALQWSQGALIIEACEKLNKRLEAAE